MQAAAAHPSPCPHTFSSCSMSLRSVSSVALRKRSSSSVTDGPCADDGVAAVAAGPPQNISTL